MLFESILTDLIIIAGILCLSRCLEFRLRFAKKEEQSVEPFSAPRTGEAA